MTRFGTADSSTLTAGASPPDTAPVFGAVPDFPFEAVPERLVLSSEAHFRLAEASSLEALTGEFASETLGAGRLVVREVAGGEVLVQADLLRHGLPSMHLDARVRQSWVVRAAAVVPGSASASIAHELVRLAELPRQSTVRVRIAAD